VVLRAPGLGVGAGAVRDLAARDLDDLARGPVARADALGEVGGQAEFGEEAADEGVASAL